MICATIGRGRHSSLTEEWEAAAKAGVDLVELRIDCLRRDPDLKRILKERPTPLVFTIRRGMDGGLWRGNEEKRQQKTSLDLESRRCAGRRSETVLPCNKRLTDLLHHKRQLGRGYRRNGQPSQVAPDADQDCGIRSFHNYRSVDHVACAE